MYSQASKNHCSQKSATFRNEISTEFKSYEPRFLAVKISESHILSIQFYARSNFCAINTISPLKPRKKNSITTKPTSMTISSFSLYL